MSASLCVCGNLRKDWQLACESCWARLPEDLKDPVWKLYQEKRGSPEHRAAVSACLKWLRDNPAPAGKGARS